MIHAVTSMRGLRRFIALPDTLYRGDTCYTPYMKADLKRTLKRLLFREKTYRALIAVDENGRDAGRILLTVAPNKQLHSDKCGFFSFYECTDDAAIANELLTAAADVLRDMGAEFFSGSFSPFDPDNRRGILVDGFTDAPVIFTSYNKAYYGAQLEAFGLKKQIDTLNFLIPYDPDVHNRLKRLATRTAERYSLRVDALNFADIERDIHDAATVMREATTELNYQEAPTESEIRDVLKGMRAFIKPEMVLFIRRIEDNTPVGFAMGLPDYFEIFRLVKGRSDPLSLLRMVRAKKKIRGMRAMLQYVVPAYQNTGAIAMAVSVLLAAAHDLGYMRTEAGTIIESNEKSIGVMRAIGGEVDHIFRIYSMPL